MSLTQAASVNTSSSRHLSLEMASVGALILTVVLAAILMIPSASIPLAPTKVLLVAAGAILTLALFILARLSRGTIVLPPLLLVGALWLPVLAYALSMLFSGVNISLATYGSALDTDTFGFILVVAVLGSLTAFILRKTEQYEAFFRWSAWGLAVVVVLSILVIVIGQFAPTFVSPTFTVVGSFQDLAALAGLGLVVSLLAMRSLSLASRTRTFLYIVGAGELIILALADVSVVWVLLALASLALFVEAVMRRSSSGDAEMDMGEAAVLVERDPFENEGHRSLAAPLAVLAVSLFFLIGSSLGSALSTSLHASTLNVRPSWQSTLATGKQVYASAPIFGSGPDTFGSSWLVARNASLNSTVFWNIDFTSGVGFIPTSFVTTGIIGALAWLILIGALLVTAGRALIFRAPEDSSARFALLAGFVGAAYLLALLIFSVPGPIIIALAFIFIGFTASAVRYSPGAKQWGVVFARSPRMGFIIVFVLTLVLLGSVASAYGLIERYVGTVDLARAQSALAAGNLATATADSSGAVAFAPSPLAYQTQALIANSQLSQLAADNSNPSTQVAQQFQSTLTSGINSALTATRIDPQNYQSWLALGNLYAAVVPLGVSGAYTNAKTTYQKAEALDPTSPNIPYLMAELEVANKNGAAAIADLQQAITLKQDDTQAIFLLSQLEVASGDLKSALNAALAAAYFTPTDPNVLFQVGLLEAANGNIPAAIQALSAAVAADAQFANARYFLAAAYAQSKDYTDALTQLQAVAALSSANAQAVAPAIVALQANKNPFPANLLSGSSTPIAQ